MAQHRVEAEHNATHLTQNSFFFHFTPVTCNIILVDNRSIQVIILRITVFSDINELNSKF